MNTNINIKPIAQSCLPLAFREDTRQLYFEAGLSHGQLSRKCAGDLQSVLRNPQNADPHDICYDFYPGVSRFEDREKFEGANLRYDIIVVYPGTVGREYKKTSGHVHSSPAEAACTYPEIYEVLQGQALFMLQKTDASGAIVEAVAVDASAGDKLIIPSHYAHATVNVGNGALIFADLVSLDCKNVYGVIAENRGMCFHVVEKDGRPIVVRNPAYVGLSECRQTGCVEQLNLGIRSNTDVYKAFTDAPKIFRYLNDPAPFADQIEHLLSGRVLS